MNVGDRVKLTPKAGGETVIVGTIRTPYGVGYLEFLIEGATQPNSFAPGDWDVEVLGKPIPTKRGAVISVDLGDGDHMSYFLPDTDCDWVDAGGLFFSWGNMQKYANEQGFTVLFEGVD